MLLLLVLLVTHIGGGGAVAVIVNSLHTSGAWRREAVIHPLHTGPGGDIVLSIRVQGGYCPLLSPYTLNNSMMGAIFD